MLCVSSSPIVVGGLFSGLSRCPTEPISTTAIIPTLAGLKFIGTLVLHLHHPTCVRVRQIFMLFAYWSPVAKSGPRRESQRFDLNFVSRDFHGVRSHRACRFMTHFSLLRWRSINVVHAVDFRWSIHQRQQSRAYNILRTAIQHLFYCDFLLSKTENVLTL